MKKSFIKRGIFTGLIAVLVLLVGCGYKPSSHYIRNVFDDTVYVDVIVAPDEPENAVYVKDALHRMVITRFGGRVVPKAQAESLITASYNGTSFSPVSYDSNGYITRYRATIRMRFELTRKKGKGFKRNISSTVEENIGASSTLSSALRIQAIRVGMARALDQFLAYAAAEGVLREEKAKK
jgi:hypothetical protein